MTDLDAALAVFAILNTVALFVVGFSIAAFRRAIDGLKKTDDDLVKRLTTVEVNVATLTEWRNGSDARFREIIAAIHDLKGFVEKRFEGYDANIARFYETYELTPKGDFSRRNPNERHL